MSQPKPLFQTFPININQGTYYFRKMGEFQILNMIGDGNFSEVYIAIPKEIPVSENSKNLNYIIKICKKNSMVGNNIHINPPKTILFTEISEIHLLNKIKNIGNDNIIKMYDWTIDRNTCEVRILMEYMPFDLRSYFSKDENAENLDENKLKIITYQILNGLKSLHQNRIIHFDLKPENILYDPEDNNIKITDFSLSQYITYDLDKKRLLNGGTFSYMPVEGLVNTKKYSFSYDIWSLGCILLELSCRLIPFKGKNQHIVLNKIISLFGLNEGVLKNFDYYCKNNLGLNFEQLRIINYIKKNIKIKLNDNGFIDLVSKMLCINPFYRINAEEALKHPWFVNN